MEEATINWQSCGNNIYIWFINGSAAITTRSYWIIGSTDGSEQQAAKEATAIASAASTVEPCDCNDKLLKKNQPAMTAITAMGLARSWPSKQKRWQKQGTSSSEARQQWLQQQPNKTINRHLIIAKTMASGNYRGSATLRSSKHHVVMRATAVSCCGIGKGTVVARKQQSTVTANDDNSNDNDEHKQKWHQQYSGEGAAKEWKQDW